MTVFYEHIFFKLMDKNKLLVEILEWTYILSCNFFFFYFIEKVWMLKSPLLKYRPLASWITKIFEKYGFEAHFIETCCWIFR